MTLLVTGAGGEIGGSLVERLRAHGLERSRSQSGVRLLSRRERPEAGEGVRWVRGELRDAASLREACAGVEIVLHMAALTHARRAAEYFAVNLEGTRNLLDAARQAGVRRFVHVSTRAIGAAGGGYSHSKKLAEDAVRDAGLPWVILRPAEVYGGGGGDPITSLARSLEASSLAPILGDGSYRLSPVHVEDVVGAIVAALDAPGIEGRTYVLAGPEELSYLELVERLERILELPRRRRVHLPVALARWAIRAASLVGVGGYVPDQVPRLLLDKSADNTAAVRDLGYAPRGLESGLGSKPES